MIQRRISESQASCRPGVWGGRRPRGGWTQAVLLALAIGLWGLSPAGAPVGSGAVCSAAGIAAAGSGFQWVYSSLPYPRISAALPTSDGGFLFAGTVDNSSDITRDLYVMKIGALGNVQWSRIYGGDFEENLVHLIPTTDGGFLLIGHTASFGPSVPLLVKIDGSGRVQWSRAYRLPFTRSGELVGLVIHRAVVASDGKILLVGETNTGGTSWRPFAAKIAEDGTLLWAKEYTQIGPGILFRALDVASTRDGGGLLVGIGSGLLPFLRSSWDVLAFKMDANGNAEWAKGYSRGGWIDWAGAVMRMSDGSFVLSGASEDPNGIDPTAGPWVARVNSTGVVQWTQRYPKFTDIMPITQTADGNLLLAGVYHVSNTDSDLLMVRMDPTNGNLLWGRRYGSRSADWLDAVVPLADGGFLLAGASRRSGGLVGQDIYVVRTDAAGSSGCLEAEAMPQAAPITNWSTNDLTIQAADLLVEIEIPPILEIPEDTQGRPLCIQALTHWLYLPLIQR